MKFPGEESFKDISALALLIKPAMFLKVKLNTCLRYLIFIVSSKHLVMYTVSVLHRKNAMWRIADITVVRPFILLIVHLSTMKCPMLAIFIYLLIKSRVYHQCLYDINLCHFALLI